MGRGERENMDRLFLAAMLAGLSYWPGSRIEMPAELLVIWKGAGVTLLAMWAAMQARHADGWLLTAVLALGAAGDVLLEIAPLAAGGAMFLAGHLVAIALYLRNRRPDARPWLIAAVPLIVLISAWLPADRNVALGIALYGLSVAMMAVAASLSRFRLAALGGWLFVISDLLIFARMGPLAESWLPGLVWPLYFAGQALIAWNVATVLGQERADARVHDRL